MSGRDSLGYMTREQWTHLTEDQRSYYLYDALIIRCQDCRGEFDSRYQKKLSGWGTIGYLALVSVSAAVGGFIASILGYPVPGKH